MSNQPLLGDGVKSQAGFFCCYCTILAGMVTVPLVMGIHQIKLGRYYSAHSSEEQCLMVDYESWECQYDCDCHSSGHTAGHDSHDEDCKTCYGIQYSYIAVVDSKCGNETLLKQDKEDTDGDCNFIEKQIGQYYPCYVLECEEGTFSFYSPTYTMGLGIFLTCLGSCLALGPLCCCCAVLCSLCDVK